MTVDYASESQEDEDGYEYSYAGWNELREAVETEGGVLRVPMWTLRELEQAGRLGVHVRASISRQLLGHGLAHLPAELPSYQEHHVVLYKLGTPAAGVIEAIRGESSIGAEKALRRLNTSRDAEKLQTITEKLAELSDLLRS
jgi:hypothetical protein